MNTPLSTERVSREWLETDGLGGFASGTVSGIRTRRYHALLLCGQNGPTGRQVLVNGIEAAIETRAGSHAISAQHYRPDVIHPDGANRIRAFGHEPWPTWTFGLEDGTTISQEIFVPHGMQATIVVWRLISESARAILRVRPLLSGRDYHATHHENGAFRFDAELRHGEVVWRPYDGIPAVHAFSNGGFEPARDWYRDFHYAEESARGLDSAEDLAAPGTFTWDLARGEAVLILAHGSAAPRLREQNLGAAGLATVLRRIEARRRSSFRTPLHRAADAYLVRRGAEHTIVAGYPWFTDWGRDTFIALRGLGMAAGRLDEARSILISWAGAISEGMVPNRFPDHGEQPEFNSVDASLWYVVAVHDFLLAAVRCGVTVGPEHRAFLVHAVETIVAGYQEGTRHRIAADTDGLLACGEPGVQLTWMDAKVGDWVVTPRIGKPVEVQALWINALWIASLLNPQRWRQSFERARTAFETRFWNDAAGCLHDVVDVDHERGRTDSAIRPNQIFAVGGLPLQLLSGERARRVVEVVERHLLTPMGLRSLAPTEPGYRPHYRGGVWERDSAYHQGTVWPWLIGAFAEAWLRVQGDTPANRAKARSRFVAPLFEHLERAGLGHVSEIADARSPHAPGGCPWQAWSVAELLRLEAVVLAPPADRRGVRPSSRTRARPSSAEPVRELETVTA